MKNIVVFSFFVCTGFQALLWAETAKGPYALSLSPQFGVLLGKGEEQVYKGEDSDELLSELLWDIKPLMYVGTKLEFARRDPTAGFGFFSSLSVKYGLPLESGNMEDRDWIWPGGRLTNYSHHDNATAGALLADLMLGPSLPLGSSFAARLSLGLSYAHFGWTARDGYLRYGKSVGGDYKYKPLEDSDPRVPVSGTVVSYAQDWVFMPMGLSLLLWPNRLFSGSLWFYAGPVFKFLGRDTHPVTSTQYRDEMSSGYSLDRGGEFRFSPLERLSLRLSCSWRSAAADPHGRTSSRQAGQDWQFRGNIAGGRFQTVDLGIGLEVRF
ncbi:MAG: omptin family outer membrane protease [Treponema sp.]|jgi:outer membrane protease|nr:omptin family outer membrane protease [Treponema sp.]